MNTVRLGEKYTIFRTVIIFVVCSFFFLMAFFYYGVRYETNDDRAMNIIAAGGLDWTKSEYLVYQNYVYGGWIRFLYHFFPHVNVYLAMMLFLNFGSVFCLSFCVCAGMAKRLKVIKADEGENKTAAHWEKWFSSELCKDLVVSFLVTVLINFVLMNDFFINLQFTKNAGLYTAVGFSILLFWFISGAQLKNLWWLLGIAYVLFGNLVRTESFIAVTAVFAGNLAIYLIWCMLSRVRSYAVSAWKSIWSQYLKPSVVPAVILCFLLISVTIVDHIAYSTPEWKEYFEYNHYRSELLDFGVPPYEEFTEEYGELGLDENDVLLLEKWIYADPGTFSKETLKKICEIKETYEEGPHFFLFGEKVLENSAAKIKSAINTKLICMCWLLILVWIIAARKFQILPFYIVSALVLFAEYAKLVDAGRINWRSEILPWIGGCSLLIILLTNTGEITKVRMDGSYRYLVVTAVLFCCIVYGAAYKVFDQDRDGVWFNKETVSFDSIKALNEQKENLYIFCVSGLPDPVDNILTIDKRYVGYYSNRLLVGGWTVPSPLSDETLYRYTDGNTMRALLQDNCYLVDNMWYHKNIRVYLEKVSGQRVLVKDMGEEGNLHLWKFFVEESET